MNKNDSMKAKEDGFALVMFCSQLSCLDLQYVADAADAAAGAAGATDAHPHRLIGPECHHIDIRHCKRDETSRCLSQNTTN